MAVHSILNQNMICQTFCLFLKSQNMYFFHCTANSLGIPLEVFNYEVEAGAQLQEVLVLPSAPWEPPSVIHGPNNSLGNR